MGAEMKDFTLQLSITKLGPSETVCRGGSMVPLKEIEVTLSIKKKK